MKKALFIILALALIFTMTACGGKDNDNKPGGNTPGTSQQSGATNPGNVPDLAGAIGGTGKLSEYDAATRQAMIDAAKAEGGNLEFKSDGSVVYTDKDGSKSIQNADGTWTYEGADGEVGQYGGDWPENEFTKLLPKPDFALTAASTNANGFTVAFTNVTAAQLKAYVEQVKAKGFTVDAETEDQEVMGIVIYSYTAKNADGYEVGVFSTQGTSGLTLKKP
jgi:hypothetical protein